MATGFSDIKLFVNSRWRHEVLLMISRKATRAVSASGMFILFLRKKPNQNSSRMTTRNTEPIKAACSNHVLEIGKFARPLSKVCEREVTSLQEHNQRGMVRIMTVK